jgi:hypothetical protein
MDATMPMTHITAIVHTGAGYISTHIDGNLGPSANGPTIVAPADAALQREDAKRPHLRLLPD